MNKTLPKKTFLMLSLVFFVLFFSVSAIAPGTYETEDGLIAHWKFDEGSGYTTKDSSGMGNHGVIYGAEWVEGKSGYALEISGTGIVEYIPSTIDDTISNSLTFSSWVKWYGPNEYNRNSYIFDGRSAGSGIHRYGLITGIYADTGRVFLQLLCPPDDSAYMTVISASPVPLNNWTHIAGVFDLENNMFSLYFNGVLDNSTSVNRSYCQAFGSPAIGNNWWAPGDGAWAPLNGMVDDIRIYNIAVAKEKIGDLMKVEYEKTPQVACRDSDGGKNYYEKGTATSGSVSLTDHCNSDGSLTEKYCSGDEIKAMVYSCPQGCSGGACLGEELDDYVEEREDKPEKPVEPIPQICNGCLYTAETKQESCLAHGTRLEMGGTPQYCDIDGTFRVQRESGDNCMNHYECKSNFCSDDECIDLKGEIQETKGLLQSIMSFISIIFGLK